MLNPNSAKGTDFSSARTGTFLNSSESEKMRKSSMKPEADLRCWLYVAIEVCVT